MGGRLATALKQLQAMESPAPATTAASSAPSDRAEVVRYAIGQIGLSWLKVFLERDARYKQFFEEA